MTEPNDSLPRHKDDFGRVYDLEDPSPYFTALSPSDYRMPEVLARALKAVHGPVSAARGAGGGLRVLDFACGYGAIGALLRHDISMADIYARYAERQWRPADGRRYWSVDAAYFAARRDAWADFEIGGTDIAGVALEYAAALGLLDRTFHENLVEDPPSGELKRFLRGVDLIVRERPRWATCCRAPSSEFSTAAAVRHRPWFIYGPAPTWTGRR